MEEFDYFLVNEFRCVLFEVFTVGQLKKMSARQ